MKYLQRKYKAQTDSRTESQSAGSKWAEYILARSKHNQGLQ